MVEETAASVFQGGELTKWAGRADHPLEVEEACLLKKWLPSDRHAKVLEGGTGVGRLAYYIESRGYQNVQAFDLMTELVQGARAIAASRDSSVRFFRADLCDVADATEVAEGQYDAIVYYQQVFSLVPLTQWDRGFDAVRRLIKPGGRWLVSFCQHEGRGINTPLRATLSALRFARGQRISGYSQPLLKHGGKLNRRFFHRDQYLIHWLPRNVIEQKVRDAGFRIIESVTAAELRSSRNHKRGMLYLTCETA